jgi:hypothetical protein
MEPLPRLLETYEGARLLLEAKGWGIAKAAEHLSEMPEMARFHISHTKLSKKTTPGSAFPIEPEVAAAVEGLETRVGYERQTEIVTEGLLARHGAPPVADVPAKAHQRAFKLLRRLAGKLGRLSWRPVAVTAASGALVGCLVLLVAGAAQPGPPVVIIPGAAVDGSPLWFEPEALLALADPGGVRPAEQQVPVKTLPGQKVAPCDEGLGQVAINGNCWVQVGTVNPPCGRLFRHGGFCYLPVAVEPKKP